jgi:hypothetical protein
MIKLIQLIELFKTLESTQLPIRYKYGYPIQSIIDIFFPKGEQTIVSVMPELQPKYHLFEDTLFIGPCLNEAARLIENKSINEEGPLKSLLESFEPINPLPLIDYFLPDNYKQAVSNRIQPQNSKKFIIKFKIKKGQNINLFITWNSIQYKSINL